MSLPEYRWDPIADRYVIVAPERVARPDQLGEEPPARRIIAPCPFCRGHEDQTPASLLCYPNQRDWQVRVIPNKFPAVRRELPAEQTPLPDPRSTPAVGAHEVIIEAPQHIVSLADLSDQQLFWTFAAYRDRLLDLASDSRLAYGQVFKNARTGGGASLEHAHSQLIATSQIPTNVQREIHNANKHFQQTERCLFCEVLANELGDPVRVVAQSETWVAFCPFASRFPYETWVMPQRHLSDFSTSDDADLQQFGLLVRDVIRRLEQCLRMPAYNYWLHTQPFQQAPQASFHWHLEIAPRLTRLAGFELGAGYFINPVAPEQAAQQLRDAK
jgi:UDPglucose--hexose-1-phosphate uridylyltransferase